VEKGYCEELRLTRSLLIVSSLRKRRDLRSAQLVQMYGGDLDWRPLRNLMVDEEVWAYVVEKQGYPPQLVFCHPEVLKSEPETSLYYRGMCAMSMKVAKGYFGAIDKMESGRSRTKVSSEKALKMARTYNAFICSIIKDSGDWTLENGRRAIVASLGITLDGLMRNKVGDIAEERIRSLILEWLVKNQLIQEPTIGDEDIRAGNPPRQLTL